VNIIKCRKPVALITGVLATLALAGIAVAAPAHAQETELCGLGGTGYCMNDWGNGGQNNAVNMYDGGYSNDTFFLQPVDACDGGDAVTADCPFSDTTFDGHLVEDGALIVQVVYVNGLCVGTASNGDAILTGCNNTATGTGGGDGTLMAAVTVGTICDEYGEGILVDRYWTNNAESDGYPAFVTSGGSLGAPLYVNDIGSATCWGGAGWDVDTGG
jgi:hypothetical protein